MPGRPEDLRDHGLAPELGALVGAQHPQGVVALDAQPDPGVRNALPDRGIARCAVALRARDDLVELVLELHLLAQGGSAALEGQRPHGDLPAAVHATDDVRRFGARARVEDLTEFRVARELNDRANLDALLPHRDQQVRDAAVLRLRLGIRATQHEAPVRPLRPGGPDFLAVDHPFVAIEASARLDVSQVGPGVWLRVALTPDRLTARDGGQEARLLFLAPEGDERGSQ